jgi:hypothetical protein
MALHTSHMLHHQARTTREPGLRAHLRKVEAAPPFDSGRIPAVPGVPGGELIHKTVAKVTIRQTQGALAELEGFARPVRDTLVAIVDALEGFMESVRPTSTPFTSARRSQERAMAAGVGDRPDAGRRGVAGRRRVVTTGRRWLSTSCSSEPRRAMR